MGAHPEVFFCICSQGSTLNLLRQSCQAIASPSSTEGLALTEENVKMVLDEVRPYLMSDGGNVELCDIDGLVVKLKLQGACGSCPSSLMTMKMGIERRLMEQIPEIVAVEQIMDDETGLQLTEENVEKSWRHLFAEYNPSLNSIPKYTFICLKYKKLFMPMLQKFLKSEQLAVMHLVITRGTLLDLCCQFTKRSIRSMSIGSRV